MDGSERPCANRANATEQPGGTCAYLQVRSHERLAPRVVKVAFHEEVEEVGGITADGAQLGVAALEDFVAERGTHVGPAVEEGAGELEDAEVARRTRFLTFPYQVQPSRHFQVSRKRPHLINEGPE